MIKEGMIYSKHLGLDWNYSIYLPDVRYADQRLPVIYLLHGAYGHHSDVWRNMDLDRMMAQMQDRGLPPMAIVMPDGFNSYYINGHAFAMEDAIMEDLLTAMEQRYYLANTKEGRRIGGIGMGGYGALRLALHYPRYFDRAYLLSPAIWLEPSTQSSVRSQFHTFGEEKQPFCPETWDRYHPLRYLSFYEEDQSPVVFRTITGEDDEVTPVSDILYVMQKIEFYASVKNIVLADAGHEWGFWQEAVIEMLQDLQEYHTSLGEEKGVT